MDRIYGKMGQFVVKAFPDLTSVDHLNKLITEAKEAIKEPKDIVEYADCLLCLFGAAYKVGFTYQQLVEATRDKLFIVENRKSWIKQLDGTYQSTKNQEKVAVQSSSVVNSVGVNNKYYEWVKEPLPIPEMSGDILPIKYKGEHQQLVSVYTSMGNIWCWHRDNYTERYPISTEQLKFVEWLKEIEYLDKSQSSSVKDDDGEVNMEDEHHHETCKVEHPNYFTSSVKDEDKNYENKFVNRHKEAIKDWREAILIGMQDIKELKEVAELDAAINTYANGNIQSHSFKHIQQLFWSAVYAINKRQFSKPLRMK